MLAPADLAIAPPLVDADVVVRLPGRSLRCGRRGSPDVGRVDPLEDALRVDAGTRRSAAAHRGSPLSTAGRSRGTRRAWLASSRVHEPSAFARSSAARPGSVIRPSAIRRSAVACSPPTTRSWVSSARATACSARRRPCCPCCRSTPEAKGLLDHLFGRRRRDGAVLLRDNHPDAWGPSVATLQPSPPRRAVSRPHLGRVVRPHSRCNETPRPRVPLDPDGPSRSCCFRS